MNSIWLLYPFATSNVLKWYMQLFSIQSLLRLCFYKIRSFWLLRWFEFIQSTIYPSTNLWNWFFLNENITENKIIILSLPIFNIAPYTIQYQRITKNLSIMYVFYYIYDENKRVDTTINNYIKMLEEYKRTKLIVNKLFVTLYSKKVTLPTYITNLLHVVIIIRIQKVDIPELWGFLLEKWEKFFFLIFLSS